MAATDNILALTKSSPIPVGPGTRRKAKNFQQSTARPGFRAKKLSKAVPLAEPKPELTELRPYQLKALTDIRSWRDQFIAYTEGLTSSKAVVTASPIDEERVKYIEPLSLKRMSKLLNYPVQSVSSDAEATVLLPVRPRPVRNTEWRFWKDTSEVTPTYGVDDTPRVEAEFGEHVPRRRVAGYLKSYLDPVALRERVDLCVMALEWELDKFDAIAFSGMSGTLIGPPVAMRLKKEMLMVRKKSENSHSSYGVEGDYAARRYIIIDDFRASGATEHRIVEAVREVAPQAKYMGFVSSQYLSEDGIRRTVRNHGSVLQPEYSSYSR